MRQFTSQEIQAQFEKLPKDLQDAITSSEINSTIEKIGDKHGLLVNQLGELVDQIGLVMLGLMPSKDFVANFSKEADIDSNVAQAIAKDINEEVFDKVRSAMQAVENRGETSTIQPPNNTQKESDITALERAGGFEIEREGAIPSTGGDYRGSTGRSPTSYKAPTSPTIPPPATPSMTPPSNLPISNEIQKPATNPVKTPIIVPKPPSIPVKEPQISPITPKSPIKETKTEPLVDRLLNNPVVNKEEKIVRKVEETQMPNTVKKVDPYREAI